MVNYKLALLALIPIRHACLSRFTHAYLAALRAAKLTKSQAAAVAGLKQSTISRLLSGDRPVYAEHLAALVTALPDASDREHCVLAWLRDQCPPDMAERLVAHFGEIHEAHFAPQLDDLDAAVAAIRRAAAAGNVSARKVVLNLARAVDPDPPDTKSRHSGGGPTDRVSEAM